MKQNAKKLLEIEALDMRLAPKESLRHTGVPFYVDFNQYALDNPDGEIFRAWLTSPNHQCLTLLAMDGANLHNSLPGAYLWAWISTQQWVGSDKEWHERVSLFLHDCDDGLAVRRWPEGGVKEAMDLLEQMKRLAPFSFPDAVSVFGLQFE